MADGAGFLVPCAPEGLQPRSQPPTFSVVIAAYQAERTVAEAVTSALEQVPPPAEVVVCDDGSTDGTGAAVEAFGDRVRLVRRPNGGEAAAKNTAVEAASGEFVVVLDADDTYLPGRLAALSALAVARPDLDVLVTDAWLEVEGRRVRRAYHEQWPFEIDDQRAEILRRNFVLGQAAVRRSRWLEVGGFDERVALTTDWDFFQRLVLSGSTVGCVAVPLATYRLRPGSLSSDRVGMVLSRIATLERVAARERLSGGERAALEGALVDQRRELLLHRLRAALADGRHARRSALRLALAPGATPSLRARALAAACLPGVAARRQARRSDTIEIGAGLRVADPP